MKLVILYKGDSFPYQLNHICLEYDSIDSFKIDFISKLEFAKENGHDFFIINDAVFKTDYFTECKLPEIYSLDVWFAWEKSFHNFENYESLYGVKFDLKNFKINYI